MNDVAVVIPCFNLGRTIEAAVDSCLGQTRTVAEVIVVDDGSSDLYTRQVLEQMRRPRTRIVRTENQGLSRTRNYGIQLSRSPYVALLDGDDILEPAYVEKTAGYLDEHAEIAFVSCALQAFGEASYAWTPNAEVIDGIVKGSLHASTLCRRAVYERVGGYDPEVPAFEASDFWICAMEHGFRGHVLMEPLLRYRVRTNSKYHKAIGNDRFLRAREALLRKHASTVETHMTEILARTDGFLVELERHRAHMMVSRDTHAAELASIERQQLARLDELARAGQPPVDWGTFRTSRPLRDYASAALRRYYEERFLSGRRADITGTVLSTDGRVAHWFGERVSRIDSIQSERLSEPTSEIAVGAYDCVLLTRVPGDPNRVRRILSGAHTALRPGGALLAAFSCVDPYSAEGDSGRDWRFTESAVRALFGERFPLDHFELESFGNVKICAAALHGLAPHEVDADTLNLQDPSFPLVTCARAVKPEPGAVAQVIRTGRHSAGERGGRGAILMYHRIADVHSDVRHLALAPAHFRAHIEHLRSRYRPIALEAMARAARDGTLPDNAVAVTLDDGYLDNLTTASPILCEYGVPATFFINTLDLDCENEFWGDTLERIFFETLGLPPEIDLKLAGTRVDLPTATAEQRTAAWRAVNRLFYPLTAEQRVALLQDVIRWSGLAFPPRRSHRRMTAGELVMLAGRDGHTIGAHTTHHLELTAHPASIRRYEMSENKSHLERLLGRPILTFSYPYGVFDAQTREIARAESFACAVTVEPGLVRPGADLLALPRLEVPLEDITVFSRFLDETFSGAAPN